MLCFLNMRTVCLTIWFKKSGTLTFQCASLTFGNVYIFPIRNRLLGMAWCLYLASFMAYSLSANFTPLDMLVAVLGNSFLMWFVNVKRLSPMRVGSPPVIPISCVLLLNKEISFRLNGVLSFSCRIGGCGHMMQRWLRRSVAISALWLEFISYTKMISPCLLITTASPSWKSPVRFTTQYGLLLSPKVSVYVIVAR